MLKENKDKDNTVQSQVATVNSSGDVEVKVESAGGQQCDSNVSTSDAEPSSRAQMIEELRNRIRQLEAEGGGDTSTTTTEPEDYKCLICLVRFVVFLIYLYINVFYLGTLQETGHFHCLLACTL